MTNIDPSSTQADYEALKALGADAAKLECIEELLDRFNVFETIGFVNDEGLHSRFLAYLLDPRRNDGLRDRLIKGVLRETLSRAHTTIHPSVVVDLENVLNSLDRMDLSQTVVRREDHDIDILLINADHKLVVIIENKIRAMEGPDQLEKYNNFVRHTYPGWDVVKIFLTRHCTTPTHNCWRSCAPTLLTFSCCLTRSQVVLF